MAQPFTALNTTRSAPPAEDAERYGTPLVRRLFILHHMMMRVGDRLTAPLGLTSARWMLLCSLARFETDATITELADEALQSPQNISRLVTELQARGLVARMTRAGAGRAAFVRLTPAGKAAVKELERCGERFGTPFLEGISPDALRELEDRLAELIENLRRFETELQAAREEPPTTRGPSPRGDPPAAPKSPDP